MSSADSTCRLAPERRAWHASSARSVAADASSEAYALSAMTLASCPSTPTLGACASMLVLPHLATPPGGAGKRQGFAPRLPGGSATGSAGAMLATESPEGMSTTLGPGAESAEASAASSAT
eukprot:scaffold326353_cov55-Tisochrysis_lutea.AAC.3